MKGRSAMKTFMIASNPGILRHARLATVTACAFLCWITLVASPAKAQNIVAWGDNSHGQLNIPGAATNILAVASGYYHNLALRADGTVIGWGGTNRVPANLSNVVSIAAGGFHSLALLSNRTVVTWDYGAFGLSTVPAAATNVIAVAAGEYFSLVLRADGTYVGWGQNTFFLRGPYYAGLNSVSVAAGGQTGYVLRDDGTVACLGPVLRSFTSAPEIVAISGGIAQDLGLTANGKVIARGSSVPAVPLQATNVVAISARSNLFLAITAEGGVIAWGSGAGTNVPGSVTNISAIAAGGLHGVAVIATNCAPSMLGSIALRDRASAGDFLPLRGRISGAQPLYYQWYAGSSPVPGNNTPFPQIPAVLGTDDVGYSLVVSNAFGSVTSSVVNVTVLATKAWGSNMSGQSSKTLGATNAVAVAAGAFHCLALNPDGTVLAWGKNNDGQATVPANATNVIAIAAGSDHSVALRNDGSVLAWGRDWSGQTDVPPVATNVVAVSAGWAHTLALRGDGSVLAWGNNEYGQTNVAGLPPGLIAVAAGYYHSAALRADGGVVSWGWDVPVPPQATNIIAIAAGWEHCLALRADGTVIAWGDNSYGQSSVPMTATGIVAIAAGYYHNLALRADGTVVAWGLGAFGVTNVPMNFAGVTAVAAGQDHSLVLVGSGPPIFSRQPVAASSVIGGQVLLSADVGGAFPMTFQWYHNGAAINGATNRFLLLTNLLPADAGSYVLVATNNNGQQTSHTAQVTVQNGPAIVAQLGFQNILLRGSACLSASVVGAEPLSFQWQFNGTNLVDGPRLSGTHTTQLCFSDAQYGDSGSYTLVVAGPYGSTTGPPTQVSVSQILGWGDNSANQLDVPPGLRDVIAVAPGAAHTLALHRDGSVSAWGDDSYGQTDVPASATNIVSVAAGDYHSLALRSDGTVVAWGDNTYRQTNVPALPTAVKAIAAGSFHNVVLLIDGTLVAWGIVPLWSPPTNVSAIAAGSSYILSLKPDRTLAASNFGVGGKQVPAAATNVVAIAAGGFHALALRGDGGVVAWGHDDFGQIDVPTFPTNVVQLAGGGTHTLALLANGQVIAWGANDSGQVLVPASATNVVAIAAGANSSFVMVTESAAPGSLRFDSVPAPAAAGHGTFRLRLAGLTAQGPITIYASPDLANWQPIYTNSPALGTLDYLDIPGSMQPGRYYWATEAR